MRKELIHQIINTLNTEVRNTSINYHFKFIDFKNESEYYTILRISIDAVSNDNHGVSVTLIEEKDEISAIESTLSVFDIIALREQQLFIKFMTSVFRILLLGINSPLIIKEVETKLEEQTKSHNKIMKLIEAKKTKK